MSAKVENHKVGVAPDVDESALAPGDEKEPCGSKPECEREEVEELQAEDPGNQGS